MLRKITISLVLCAVLLLGMSTLVAAQGGGQGSYQDMATPTPAVPLNGNLPLANSQTGNCPMMSGAGMSGSAGMAGMQMGDMAGMQGQGMSGTSGMQGMSGMSGMSGMQSMSGMSGMNGGMAYYAAPWYTNPWLMLGWILMVLVIVAIALGIVLAARRMMRREAPVQAEVSS